MAEVHPSAVVEKDVELGRGVVIGPNCYVGSGVSVGAGTVLGANVVVEGKVKLGKNNHLCSGCVIGGRPQLLRLGSGDEIGGLEIGDGNTVREQVTIHPSMRKGKCTKVGNGNLLMIGAHIGHDCIVEDSVVLSNCTLISGHCRIETGVWLSGVVCVHQFVTIGRWCYAAGLSGINHDVPPFLIISGHYPPRVRGVNKRGLARAGLGEKQRGAIYEAYKRLYRGEKRPLLETAKAMAAEDGLDENVRLMVEAIIRSSEHRFGRHLERFRD